MKTKLILSLIICIYSMQLFSQTTNDKGYKGKIFVFDYYEQIEESDNMGVKTGVVKTALQGSLFTVVRVCDNQELVIRFNKWGEQDATSVANRQAFNFKDNTMRMSIHSQDDNVVFFVLKKGDFDKSCSEYIKNWDISFGTFTTPFKIRRKPFLFTTDLNLGASVGYQRRITQNFYWGVIGGLSLSSVKLDSASTGGLIKTGTDRPAITPSINAMLGYQKINFTFGFGWDFISKSSKIEESWRYYGKRWFGVGIGVSLFNKQGSESKTEVDAKQAKK